MAFSYIKYKIMYLIHGQKIQF